MKKIYTEKFNCALCQKPVEEYAKTNRSRVVRSWVSICCKCFYKKGNPSILEKIGRLTRDYFKRKSLNKGQEPNLDNAIYDQGYNEALDEVIQIIKSSLEGEK